jgi:hypothetical protein
MDKSSFVGGGADIRMLVTFYVHSTSKVTSDGQPGEAIDVAGANRPISRR